MGLMGFFFPFVGLTFDDIAQILRKIPKYTRVQFAPSSAWIIWTHIPNDLQAGFLLRLVMMMRTKIHIDKHWYDKRKNNVALDQTDWSAYRSDGRESPLNMTQNPPDKNS